MSTKVKLLNFFGTLAILAMAIMVLFSPPKDPDFGWHYKYGEQLLATHQTPGVNTFSYIDSSYQWLDSYWLFELLLYVVFSNVGAIAYSLVTSTITAVVCWQLLKKPARHQISLVYIYFILIVLLQNFCVSVRPHFISTTLLMFLCYTLVAQPKNIKFLPLMFLFWANIHADFVLGLFIFGLYTLQKVLFEKDYKTLLAGVLSGLVTLINPAGINLWLTMLRELSLPIKSSVGEWGASDLNALTTMVGTIILFTTFFTGVLLTKKVFKPWYFISAFIFLILSTKAIYMLRIFAIVTSFMFLATFDRVIEIFIKVAKLERTSQMGYVLKILAILSTPAVVFFVFIPNLQQTASLEKWSTKANYPYQAVQYLKQNKPAGKMLNNYNWGGYFIWQMPEYETFIDGRMTSWKIGDKYFMDDYLKIRKAPGANKELLATYLKDYDINFVIEEPKSKLLKYLKEDKSEEWQVVYEDDIAVIVTKRTR